jgi:hypothetical protein
MNISLGAVLAALLFLIPGYLVTHSRRMMMIVPKADGMESLLQWILWSIVLYVVAIAVGLALPTHSANVVQCIDLFATSSVTQVWETPNCLRDTIAFFIALWFVAWLVGFPIGALERRGLLWWIARRVFKSRFNRYISEFDALIEDDPEWVTIILKDGALISGIYKSASVTPQPKEIQLTPPILWRWADQAEASELDFDRVYVPLCDIAAVGVKFEQPRSGERPRIMAIVSRPSVTSSS